LDGNVGQYLKIFTLISIDRITEILDEHVKSPEKRLAQRILAEEVVTLVHSSEVAQQCILQTAALYPAPLTSTTNDTIKGKPPPNFKPEFILQAFQGDETMLKRFSKTAISDISLPQLLKMIGLAKSNSIFSFAFSRNRLS
jgi:tyrosyl-tRNA synthetase